MLSTPTSNHGNNGPYGVGYHSGGNSSYQSSSSGGRGKHHQYQQYNNSGNSSMQSPMNGSMSMSLQQQQLQHQSPSNAPGLQQHGVQMNQVSPQLIGQNPHLMSGTQYGATHLDSRQISSPSAMQGLPNQQLMGQGQYMVNQAGVPVYVTPQGIMPAQQQMMNQHGVPIQYAQQQYPQQRGQPQSQQQQMHMQYSQMAANQMAPQQQQQQMQAGSRGMPVNVGMNMNANDMAQMAAQQQGMPPNMALQSQQQQRQQPQYVQQMGPGGVPVSAQMNMTQQQLQYPQQQPPMYIQAIDASGNRILLFSPQAANQGQLPQQYQQGQQQPPQPMMRMTPQLAQMQQMQLQQQSQQQGMPAGMVPMQQMGAGQQGVGMYPSNIYQSQRVPVQGQPNMAGFQPGINVPGGYMPSQQAVPGAQQQQPPQPPTVSQPMQPQIQGQPVQPQPQQQLQAPVQPSPPQASQQPSAPAPAPAPVAEKKRPVIKDKDGNILDLTSLRKNASSTTAQAPSKPTIAPTVPTPASAASTAVDANVASSTSPDSAKPTAPVLSEGAAPAVSESTVRTATVGGDKEPKLDAQPVKDDGDKTIEEAKVNLHSAEFASATRGDKGVPAVQTPSADEAAPDVPPGIVEVAPVPSSSAEVSATTIPEKRNKKALRDMLNAADASADKGSLLDAFTPTEAKPDKVTPAPVPAAEPKAKAATVAPTPATPVPPSNATAEMDDEDDWEATAAKIEQGDVPVLVTSSPTASAPAAAAAEPTQQQAQAPAAPAAPRRLAPGGGLMQMRLNQGPAQAKAVVKYSKEEILKLRPLSIPERPQGFQAYSSISVIPEESSSSSRGATPSVSKAAGYWNRGELTRHFERSMQSHSPAPTPSSSSAGQQHQHGGQFSRDGRDGKDGHHGGGGGGLHQQSNANQFNSQQMGGNYHAQQYWKRMQDNGRGSRNRGPAPPRPKKVVTDPIEALALEVMSLLNKISPPTFEKLMMKLCELQISTFGKLEKLISLIFEKAIQEPSFAHMYAELCVNLEKASRNWPFIQVVFNEDLGQYFFIKDLEIETETYGPFESDTDCLQAVMSGVTLNPATKVPETVVHRTTVTSETLIQVCMNSFCIGIVIIVMSVQQIMVSKDAAHVQYYVAYVPFNDLDRDKFSDNIFETEADAEKDSQKQNCFKRKLVSVCQEEFQNSCSSATVCALYSPTVQMTDTDKLVFGAFFAGGYLCRGC
jgi:hypothetical protein